MGHAPPPPLRRATPEEISAHREALEVWGAALADAQALPIHDPARESLERSLTANRPAAPRELRPPPRPTRPKPPGYAVPPPGWESIEPGSFALRPVPPPPPDLGIPTTR